MATHNIKTLTIDRSKWGFGPVDGGKLLKSETGRMCCLGFLAKRCGATEEVLDDKNFPEIEHAPTRDWARDGNAAMKAAQINDAGDDYVGTTRRTAEKLLTEHFAENGITLKFKGRYGKVKAKAA